MKNDIDWLTDQLKKWEESDESELRTKMRWLYVRKIATEEGIYLTN